MADKRHRCMDSIVRNILITAPVTTQACPDELRVPKNATTFYSKEEWRRWQMLQASEKVHGRESITPSSCMARLISEQLRFIEWWGCSRRRSRVDLVCGRTQCAERRWALFFIVVVAIGSGAEKKAIVLHLHPEPAPRHSPHVVPWKSSTWESCINPPTISCTASEPLP